MEKKSKPKRCDMDGCKKKIGLLGFECKCGKMFCMNHRHAEDHECTFDHKQCGLNTLESKLIKVSNEKIIKI